MPRPYRKVWTGGTFDHLHAGHHELLSAAFEAGDYVVIGITDDEVVRDKAFSDFLQPLAERTAALEAWLTETFGRERFEVVVQGAVYTDASLDPELEANVLCYKTEHHFHDINRRREARGVKALESVMSPQEHKGEVSSTRIRQRLAEDAPKGRRRRRRKGGTKTSAFGVGKRESHDASAFYERFEPPEVDDSTDIGQSVPPTPFLCRDARDMAELEDGSVALVVTSPPYYAGKEYERDVSQGHVPASYNEYRRLLFEVFSECKRVLEPGGRIAVNVANLGRRPYRSLAADVTGILQEDLHLLLRGEVVWQKGKGASGSCAWGSFRRAANPVLRDLTERVIIASKWRFDRALSVKERERRGLPHRSTLSSDEFMEATLDLWEIPAEIATRVGHPAPFPVELPQRLIELYTYEGDLVLDPFMGAGTTLVAAARTGRRYVGYDLEPPYVARARQRVEAELRRLELAGHEPVQQDLYDEVARPFPRGSQEEAESFHAQAVEGGRKAHDLAEAALERAGFEIQARQQRLRGLGLAVDLVLGDRTGGTWYADVTGSFTLPPGTGARAGLLRNDTVWQTLGRAHLLARQRGDDGPPLLLLTSHLPAPRSDADRALRAVGPRGFFDALTMLCPVDAEVLRHYAEAGAAGGPHPDGFWSEADRDG